MLDKQLGYYVLNTAIRLSLLAASLAFLSRGKHLVAVLNAAFLGFVFTQIGFLGHDAGHRQIFDGAARNDHTV